MREDRLPGAAAAFFPGAQRVPPSIQLCNDVVGNLSLKHVLPRFVDHEDGYGFATIQVTQPFLEAFDLLADARLLSFHNSGSCRIISAATYRKR
ncbi:MAG: hypothetical protein ACREUR_11240 [Nitrosospira sp.]